MKKLTTEIILRCTSCFLKVLSLDELRDINGGLDLQVDTDAEMEMFLQFLHDTGEIIFFR